MRHSGLFSILALFILLSSCSKDKFGSRPNIKMKSVNTTQLNAGEVLQFVISFTDSEGDISNSIYVQKIEPHCSLSNFQQEYALPTIPPTKNMDGELIVTFGYNKPPYVQIGPRCAQNDTAVFRFALKDKAGNVSDTISSPSIIIYR